MCVTNSLACSEMLDPGRVWVGLERAEACSVWAGLRCSVPSTLSGVMTVPVEMRTKSLSLISVTIPH